jgi:hypothetical protein
MGVAACECRRARLALTGNANVNKHINESLRKRVRLETLYPHRLKYHLAAEEGVQITGLYRRETGEILIGSYLEDFPRRLVGVYLHEVGHLIADKSGLDVSPDADAHNQYFAVLVAVMYRRANLLESLKIYDFCDTSAGQRSFLRHEPLLDDEDLIARFQYILRRSEQLAKTRLSIEQIAKKLHEEDAIPHWLTAELAMPKAKKIGWSDVLLGALLGASFAAAASVTTASLLLK